MAALAAGRSRRQGFAVTPQRATMRRIASGLGAWVKGSRPATWSAH
jgi:hypothetical protein